MNTNLPKTYRVLLECWVAHDLGSFRRASQVGRQNPVKSAYGKRRYLYDTILSRRDRLFAAGTLADTPNPHQQLQLAADALDEVLVSKKISLSKHLAHLRESDATIPRRAEKRPPNRPPPPNHPQPRPQQRRRHDESPVIAPPAARHPTQQQATSLVPPRRPGTYVYDQSSLGMRNRRIIEERQLQAANRRSMGELCRSMNKQADMLNDDSVAAARRIAGTDSEI